MRQSTSAVIGIDRPPAMTSLSLIPGGKADMLPAEPVTPDRRRRIASLEV
jgi:hypothetical protein